MGFIGGLLNSHASNDVGKSDFQAQDTTSGNSLNANNQLFGSLSNALQGGGFGGAGQSGLGAFNQGLASDAAAAANQNQLVQSLQDQAAGRGGPSLAQQQLQSALAQNQKQAASAIASQRGLNPALAARLIGEQQGQAVMTAAGQSAALRSQEQLNAQNALAQVLGQQRQGAQGIAGLGQGLYGAGTQSLGTIGQLFNTGSQNAAENAMRAQQLNQDTANRNAANRQAVAVGNAAADNATGGAVLNSVGGMFGLAHGGPVPASPSGAEALERPSFAEMVAHHIVKADGDMHLSRVMQTPMAHGGMAYAKGGTVKPTVMYIPHDYKPAEAQGPSSATQEGQDSEGKKKVLKLAKGGPVRPYSFPALDLRPDAATAGQTAAQPGQEGTDSEGKKKVLKLADGGVADSSDESSGLNMTNPHGGSFLQGVGDFFANAAKSAGQSLVQKFDNSKIGQLLHPGVQTFGAGSGGPLVSLGNSTAGAPTMPTADAPMPMGVPGMGGGLGGSHSLSAIMQAHGGPVPGRAQHVGDDERNDTVPVMLSPGEVVIPRSLATKPAQAKRFIEHLMEMEEGE